jgi:hypothetical protein
MFGSSLPPVVCRRGHILFKDKQRKQDMTPSTNKHKQRKQDMTPSTNKHKQRKQDMTGSYLVYVVCVCL